VKYEIVDGSEGPTLMLRDQLNFADREPFDTMTDKLFARRSRIVAIDLSGLDYMDSAGLGMLLSLRERADKAGVDVQLQRPKGEVRELLALACFDTLFTVSHE